MLANEGLNAHYGASHVLQGVDLEVPDGTIVAVLGRNGVGKTTTVRAIMGLVPPSSGRVFLNGEDIAGWAPHRVARAGVAYVPEGRLIFPDLTVVENTNVLKRKYAGLTTQLTYRFSSSFDVGGNYTLSRLWGNVNGENLKRQLPKD